MEIYISIDLIKTIAFLTFMILGCWTFVEVLLVMRRIRRGLNHVQRMRILGPICQLLGFCRRKKSG